MSTAVPPMPHAPRLGPQALLGGLLVIAAAVSLLGALVAPPALAGPQVLAPAGLVLAGLAATTAVVGRRPTALLVLVLAAVMVTTVLLAEAPTLAGQVFCSMAYIYVVLYAAYVLERWRALVVLATVLVLSLVAQLVSVPGLTPRVWVATIGAITVTGLVLGHVMRLLRWHAGTDTLTGLLTRATFTLASRTALAGDRRRQVPTTIAVLDLDHFKLVNDTQGHAAGDAVLRGCVRSWASRLRQADLLGRIGGDEFVLLLPGTDAEGAAHVVADLRSVSTVGFSCGIAVAGPTDEVDDMIARADAEMYAVKRGRQPARASTAAG